MILPTREQLQGLSVTKAEMYGKPNCGAFYKSRNVKSHAPLSEFQRCVICGRPCTNVHHEPPLRNGYGLLALDPNGRPYLDEEGQYIVMRPALFALCGSGTTGCHDGFHGGARFYPTWVWDNEQYKNDWWSGRMLDIIGSPMLYDYGHWEVEDRKRGGVLVIAS